MCWAQLALTAAGTGLSALGRQKEMKDERDRTGAVVDARNEVLRQQSGLIDALGQQNMADMGGLVGLLQTDPAQAQAARTAFLESSMAPVDEAPIPLSENAPQIAKAEYAKQARKTFADSKARAGAAGQFGGFGDMLFGNALAANRTAGNIDMRNDFARTHAQMLPSLQQFATIGATRAPDSTGQLLQAGGRLLGQMGGAMGGGSGGSFGQTLFGGTGGPQQIARGMGGRAGAPMGPSYLTGVY